ncbi:hypothetical protein ACJX0J_010995 [Zea mays]
MVGCDLLRASYELDDILSPLTSGLLWGNIVVPSRVPIPQFTCGSILSQVVRSLEGIYTKLNNTCDILIYFSVILLCSPKKNINSLLKIKKMHNIYIIIERQPIWEGKKSQDNVKNCFPVDMCLSEIEQTVAAAACNLDGSKWAT